MISKYWNKAARAARRAERRALYIAQRPGTTKFMFGTDGESLMTSWGPRAHEISGVLNYTREDKHDLLYRLISPALIRTFAKASGQLRVLGLGGEVINDESDKLRACFKKAAGSDNPLACLANDLQATMTQLPQTFLIELGGGPGNARRQHVRWF
jgi:hypothetical protein